MHRLTFYMKFSRHRNKVLSMKSRLSCDDSKPPQSLQASACSQIRNNEHKLENRIKMLIKFWFSPFYVCDSTFVPHSNSHNSKDHWPLSAFSVGLTVLMALKSCLEAHNPKKVLMTKTSWNHKSQTGPWASETCGCIGNLHGRWRLVQNLFSPAFSAFLSSGFPLHLRNLGEVLPLPTQLCQFTEQPLPWGFFWAYCFFHEPSCLRKALEDGTSVGNTGTESKEIAWWTN